MNFIRTLILSISLLTYGSAFAGSAYLSDRDFNQDRMITTSYSVMILSPFEDSDYIASYGDHGTLLWEISFNPKVMSWKMKDGLLYVFSKSRYLEKTYLHCIDPASGKILWERP